MENDYNCSAAPFETSISLNHDRVDLVRSGYSGRAIRAKLSGAPWRSHNQPVADGLFLDSCDSRRDLSGVSSQSNAE